LDGSSPWYGENGTVRSVVETVNSASLRHRLGALAQDVAAVLTRSVGACYGFVGMLIIGQPMISATQANDRGCDAVSPLALSDYLPGTDPQYGAGRNAEGVLRLNHQDIAHPSVGIF
jgi:hypothetical protein